MPEQYGTADGFRTWITARNVAVGDSDDDLAVNAALLVASEWLDGRYRSSFPGLKLAGRDQVREWPRSGVIDVNGYGVDSDTVPTEVENATYAATVREMATPGTLSRDYTPNKYESVSVYGAVAVKYRSFDSAVDSQIKLQIVDEILAPLIAHGITSGLSGCVYRA